MYTYCSKNTYASYSMAGFDVTNSYYERDLGVDIDESLNYNRQCAKAVFFCQQDHEHYRQDLQL